MSTANPPAARQFQWEPQPRAQNLVNELLDGVLGRCPGGAALAQAMKAHAGTRFADWVDSIETTDSAPLAARLADVGFTPRPLPGAPTSYVHDGAMFPTIVLRPAGVPRANVKVDSVADFLACWKLDHEIHGEAFGQFRTSLAFRGDAAEVWVVERRGCRGFEVPAPDAGRAIRAVHHLEAFRRRRRDFGVGTEADSKGFAHAEALVGAAIRDLGRDWACDLWFQSERDYWQRRNRAARVQKARQDALGLGWANHDHHTYRCSRQFHSRLVAFLELLGFTCRERFYEGAEAGWGAQVLEQPVAGITIFADVDMSAEEVEGDFSHAGLSERRELGTIGLWVALHGESFLQAGMHHLECQFDWWTLKHQLESESGVRMMDPFTTFPFLRQAFTEGERWPLEESRISRLERSGQITPTEAAQFRANGAVGSHLENLERNDGYKGFNQGGVSHIITKTDPRRLVGVK